MTVSFELVARPMLAAAYVYYMCDTTRCDRFSAYYGWSKHKWHLLVCWALTLRLLMTPSGHAGLSPTGLMFQKPSGAAQAIELWLGTAVSPALCEVRTRVRGARLVLDSCSTYT